MTVFLSAGLQKGLFLAPSFTSILLVHSHAFVPPVKESVSGSHFARPASSVCNANSSFCLFQRAKGALQSITVGQKVISKHKNGRFYQCEVVTLTTETFYEVNFDDGSFSDNLYPEDIVVMSEGSQRARAGLRPYQRGPTQTERSVSASLM